VITTNFLISSRIRAISSYAPLHDDIHLRLYEHPIISALNPFLRFENGMIKTKKRLIISSGPKYTLLQHEHKMNRALASAIALFNSRNEIVFPRHVYLPATKYQLHVAIHGLELLAFRLWLPFWPIEVRIKTIHSLTMMHCQGRNTNVRAARDE